MHALLDWSIEEFVKSLPTVPDEMLAYKLPEEMQRRAAELIALSKAGKLAREAKLEADRLFELEGKIMLLKLKALKAKKRQ